MQCRRLIFERVLDIDYELVALGHPNGGDGPLSVDANDRTSLQPIRIRVNPRYFKVVCDGGTVGQGQEQGYWKEEV